MKFSRSLQFNAVPEWTEQYVDFQGLKALAHQIEATRQKDPKEAASMEQAFQTQFAAELEKVLAFYRKTHGETMAKYNELQTLVSEWSGPSGEVSSVLPRREHRPSLIGEFALFPGSGAAGTESSPEFGFKFDDAAKTVYLTLHDLHEYLYMNHTGFVKLAKALEKHTGEHQSAALVQKVDSQLPMDNLGQLDTMMQEIERAYARICCDGNLDEATVYLRHLLHERILHERASVWQDMVAAERKTNEITVVSTAPTAAAPSKKKAIPWKQIISLLVCLTAFLVLYFVPIFPDRVMQNGAVLLVTCTLLWCTEALPLYITSLLVPVMVIILRVLKEEKTGIRLNAVDTSKAIFSAMFSNVIMLLLGGFSIAAALSKNGITKALACTVLTRIGRRPSVVLLSVMAVTVFMSMWVSNVAAPVLAFTIMGPMMRSLGADHPLAKAICLGVAYAANIGGLTTPIASPQSIITITWSSSGDKAAPGWPQWLAFATPVAWIATILVWAVLVVMYPCKALLPESCVVKGSSTPWTGRQYFVAAVAGLTIVLWIVSDMLKEYIGTMATFAVLPLVLYFGTGILGKDDFNGFMWNIVVLAMGGSALGKGVQSSGLLNHIGKMLGDALGGYSQYLSLAIFGFCVLIITTFISHTVGALIFLPLVKEVGEKMVPDPHPRLFVIVCGMMCSAGMGMPISGFPNMSAVSQEDATGRTFIGTIDFVKTGLLSSVLLYGTIMTVGYGIARALGY